jgi:hypothetical protein
MSNGTSETLVIWLAFVHICRTDIRFEHHEEFCSSDSQFDIFVFSFTASKTQHVSIWSGFNAQFRRNANVSDKDSTAGGTCNYTSTSHPADRI